jgi:uncharacterized protein YjiS (DUF1127 family)
MATMVHARETVHGTRPAVAPVVRIANAVSNFLRAWKNRREFYRLGEMSDTELADIGLTRTDLSVAIDLPFGRDPTAHLGALAETRQREIEAMARQVS